MRAHLPSAIVVLGWTLACTAGKPETPPCPPPPECPPATREVVVVPVFDDGAAEHWCCAYDEAGQRRFALTDNPTACRAQYGDRGGAWTEGPECLPCCCRVPVSETDASRGARYERTSPVACAGVGECLPGAAPECDSPPDGVHPRAKRGHR